MTSRTSRDSLAPLAVAFLVAFAILTAVRIAFADTGGTTTIETDFAVWTANGPWWAGIVLVYGALHLFLGQQHRLAQGRLLAGLTGASLVLAAVINWRFVGAPVGGIFTAILAAFALLKMPTVAAPTVPAATARNASLVLFALVAGIGGGIAGTSCTPGSNARTTLATGVVAALDCEAAHLDAGLLADARAAADAKVQGWISGTAPADLDALSAKVGADLAPFASDLGHCAIAGALAAALAVASNALVPHGVIDLSATPQPRPASARAAFAVAARRASWAPVRLAGGAAY